MPDRFNETDDSRRRIAFSVNKRGLDLQVPLRPCIWPEGVTLSEVTCVVFYSPHDGKRLVKRVVGRH